MANNRTGFVSSEAGRVLVASEPLSRRSILRTYNAAATKTPDHRSLTAKRPVARSLSPQ